MSNSAIYFVLLPTFPKTLQSTNWFPIVKLRTDVHALQPNHTCGGDIMLPFMFTRGKSGKLKAALKKVTNY